MEGLTLGEKLVVLKTYVIILWLAEFLCIGSSPQMVTLAFGIINSLRKKLKKLLVSLYLINTGEESYTKSLLLSPYMTH